MYHNPVAIVVSVCTIASGTLVFCKSGFSRTIVKLS